MSNDKNTITTKMNVACSTPKTKQTFKMITVVCGGLTKSIENIYRFNKAVAKNTVQFNRYFFLLRLPRA